MAMNHRAKAVDAAVLSTCSNCHAGLASGVLSGGKLHASLATLGAAQPAACTECHLTAASTAVEAAMPTGFVGPTAAAPARMPPSGEMRHDAHLWVAGSASSTLATPQECALCHSAPGSSGSAVHWTTGKSGASAPLFHASVSAQPGSCIDCHANTRPTQLVTSGALTFDHQDSAALGDCTTCHQASAPAFQQWSGGLYHLAGSATPRSCLPCHAGERPTSTASWTGTAWQTAPFDFVPNAQGLTHGDGQDCAVCHTGPGTGAWGGAPKQNWQGGSFNHSASQLAKQTCIACHTTQRADLNQAALTAQQLARIAAASSFDHAVNGQGDCFGCHQASVAANTFASYASDWQGGKAYPGSTPVGAVAGGITVTEYTLLRSAATSLVTGVSSAPSKYFLNMVHTAAAIPSQLSPGPDAAPNMNACWHCHTHALQSTQVTSYSNGNFHGSLAGYQATPTSTVSALPEPATCTECHGPMRPQGIVLAQATASAPAPAQPDLQPLDHAAAFTAAVVINGVSPTSTLGIDCGVCHKNPGGSFSSAGSSPLSPVFHANIGGAQPASCVTCHYQLMADTAHADIASATKAKMTHLSSQVPTQECQTCHTGALAKGNTTSPASTLWSGGAFHAKVPSQPGACIECHSGALPAAATQGNVSYTFAQGGTASNGRQWMNHSAPSAVGKECAICHLADAAASAAANGWNKSDKLHAALPSPAACQGCHGLTNGNGTVPGTGNNLPSGPTDSPTLTTADATTGVAANTHAQLSHADANVSGKDCLLCHSPPAASTPAGKEWAQASFHSHFTSLDTASGRCSNCHINEKPSAATFSPSHAGFTATAGTQDCSSCHTYPGTGTAAAPNWLGATGAAPATFSAGGYTIPAPPAASATTQTTVNNVKHPANTSCTSCHTGGVGGLGAIGYDHSSTAASCNVCHEAGSNLLSPAWNKATSQSAGLGDTRPFTLTATSPWWQGCTWTGGTHFYGADCSVCHTAPSGVVKGAATNSALQTAWRSKGHPPKNGNSGSGWCAECHLHGCTNN
jgi:Cytochrome c7 and related cytochrome c